MPRLNPAAPETGFIVSKSTGLKNTVQQERLSETDLMRAVNIDIDDDGQISRRRGYTQMVSGNAHSLFGVNKRLALVVFNGVLNALHLGDYSMVSLGVNILGSDPSKGEPPLSYVQVGTTVYYSGSVDSGKVDIPTLTRSAWQGSPPSMWLSPVVNPTPTLPPIAGKSLGPPPNATDLAYFNGKIYMAVGNYVWFTELYLYDYVDVTGGFLPFEAPVTMLGTVGDGVYVGTKEGCWFLSASKDFKPEKAYGLMKRQRVMDSPVLPGSKVYIPSELGNPPQIPPTNDQLLQVGLAFMTNNGFCVAQDGGQIYNLTESKYFFPNAVSAAAMYRRQDGINQYVTTLQSGGTPAQNAAIGDYIDVTIIRGGGTVPGPTSPSELELYIADGIPLLLEE